MNNSNDEMKWTMAEAQTGGAMQRREYEQPNQSTRLIEDRIKW
jgi:hypothetical protein